MNDLNCCIYIIHCFHELSDGKRKIDRIEKIGLSTQFLPNSHPYQNTLKENIKRSKKKSKNFLNVGNLFFVNLFKKK